MRRPGEIRGGFAPWQRGKPSRKPLETRPKPLGASGFEDGLGRRLRSAVISIYKDLDRQRGARTPSCIWHSLARPRMRVAGDHQAGVDHHHSHSRPILPPRPRPDTRGHDPEGTSSSVPAPRPASPQARGSLLFAARGTPSADER